jgi:hypothetical protein
MHINFPPELLLDVTAGDGKEVSAGSEDVKSCPLLPRDEDAPRIEASLIVPSLAFIVTTTSDHIEKI